MKVQTRSRAFTIIELLVCMALASVILGFAIPPLQDILQRSRATASVNWIVGCVAFTRHAAISRHATITLCPSTDGLVCGKQWINGSMAFIDFNRDGKMNGKDLVLKRFAAPVSRGSIKWRSFRNKQYLQMTPEGLTNYQNGNFVYCTESQDPRFSRQVIINAPGRTRLAHDLDGDGVIEDRRGKPLRC